VPGFLVPFLKFREDDNNGRALAGGRLYSYAAGTSQPLSTYFNQDLAAGHENTNPVILDASGRADVWIQDGVGYKFVLKDALDNTIYTQDNVKVSSGGGGGGGGSPTTPGVALQVPLGSIFAFGGSVAPQRYLICDGSPVNQATFKDLFEIIGTTYGGGGSTFNLPNLRQRFPIGVALSGPAATLGFAGGEWNHTHTGPSHQHTVNAHTHGIPRHQHIVPRDGWGSSQQFEGPGVPQGRILTFGGNYANLATNDNVSGWQEQVDTTPVSITTNPEGSGLTSQNNPPYLVLNFIIKALKDDA
jgi:microcystin-dependent protein